MRIRATAAAVTVSGALALTAFAVPAQADGDSARSAFAQAKAELKAGHATAFSARSAAGDDDQYGDTAISKIVINGGKDVVLGTTKATTVKVTFQATDDSGIDAKSPFGVLYHGADVASSDAGTVSNEDGETTTSCKTVNATTSNCTLTFPLDPQFDLRNFAAGKWKAAILVVGKDGDFSAPENAKTFSVKRYAKLSTNATPEPIAKGKTLTVKGALTRANWDTSKYAGYTKQKVTLQFRKKTSSNYTTLKTVTSDTKGNLSTTVKASADGYFRYKFAGTSTTPAVTSTSDFVDVR
ncbi:calcium-binding protein [Streptomyces sp. HUAS MG91]|uniref:Calcium-binding protein n=1 Tax=Streptomyces tabacisoli TaxID=3156398 RepID=A0AAU8IWF0_9ACTN